MTQPGMIYKRNAEGNMVPVALSAACGGDGSEVESKVTAPATDAVIHAQAHVQNPKKDYTVLIKPGKGKAKKKFYWSRIHKGKVRATGHEGFDSVAKALKDEAFDRQMVQVGQPTIEQPNED